MSLIKLRLFPFMPKLLRAFTLNECWLLQNAFSASVKVIPWFFYFSLTWWLYWLVCEYWASLSFWDKLPELWGVTLFICVCVCVCVLSCVWLFVAPWTVARHLCPWDLPGKNTGVGCHFLLQGNLPSPGTEPTSLVLPALSRGFFTTAPLWEVTSFFYVAGLFAKVLWSIFGLCLWGILVYFFL